MKVRIFSEDYPNGLEADWSSIPSKGDIVTFDNAGGASNLEVDEVRWLVDRDRNLSGVELHLKY
jgi:hypothetical protein